METLTPQPDSPISPPDLEAVGRQFAQWRTTRQKIERIPQSLWQAAASLYPRYSVHQIARALRLDFVDLRAHIHPAGPARRRSQRKVTLAVGAQAESAPFLELPVPTAAAGPSECIVKLKEGPRGTRITIRMKGAGVRPLVELLQALWRGSR